MFDRRRSGSPAGASFVSNRKSLATNKTCAGKSRVGSRIDSQLGTKQ